MSVIKKKKHVSKKNKKDWRKHCDIQDVENFLEDQRLEERLGKFDTKPDSELFVVDTGVDDKIKEDVTEKPLTNKQRKRAQLSATPKCYEVLLPNSKVQDPNAKRNKVNAFGTKPTALSKISEARKEKKGAYVKKLELARKNRKIALEKRRKVKQINQNFGADLWGDAVLEAKGIPSTLIDEFISTEAVIHNVLVKQRVRPKPPLAKTMMTRAAVEAPHPGVSYNPTYQEHQNLLQQVGSHEVKMMKKEKHLERVTTGMFRKITAEERDDQWRAEMSSGLQPEKPSQPSDAESDNEYKPINPPVQNKKKDHKARRKQKEQILEKERLKQVKINKKKISDIYTLRKLQSTILTKEQKQAQERELRQTKRAQMETTSLPHLSKHKTPIQEPDLVEPSQLTGDLRNISNNSNLLRERYESLQRRGAIAAAKLMMKKKRRVKSYFKPGHKVTDQDVDKFMAKFKGKGKA